MVWCAVAGGPGGQQIRNQTNLLIKAPPLSSTQSHFQLAMIGLSHIKNSLFRLLNISSRSLDRGVADVAGVGLHQVWPGHV